MTPHAIPAQPATRRPTLDAATVQVVMLVGFLAVLCALFAVLEPRFVTTNNILTVLGLASVIGIISLGQTLTIISGGFDLSVSGVVPLAGVAYAMLSNSGLAWPVALLLVIGIGAAVGLVNGVFIALLKVNPLIATLGVLSLSSGFALTLADGRQVQFENFDAGVLAEASIGDINNQTWIFIALSVVLFFVLRRTAYGRLVYAVGGNEEAARLAGIRTKIVIASVYVICGALAAVAGVILASQLLTGSGTAGVDSNLTSIAAVVLGGAALTGGRGGVVGTVLGVLILGVLANGLSLLQVPTFYQTMTSGAVLLLAVLVGRIDRLPGVRRTS